MLTWYGKSRRHQLHLAVCYAIGTDIEKGKRFERWTVVALGSRRVICKCDCGTERDVLIQSLLNGRSRSCGCLAREIWAEVGRKKLKHPINVDDRFGRLMVLDASDRTAVLCRCDCGKEKRVQASALYSAMTRSCGCLYLESAKAKGHANAGRPMNPGDRFGRLTVLDATRRAAVLCRCGCGKRAPRRGSQTRERKHSVVWLSTQSWITPLPRVHAPSAVPNMGGHVGSVH